jgi:hypothetical protein
MLVIVIVGGLGIQGISVALRRHATGSAPAVLAGACDGLGLAAEQASGTGRIHGCTIIYQGVGQPGILVPWYVDPGVTDGSIPTGSQVITCTSAAALEALVHLRAAQTPVTSIPGALGWILPLDGVVASYFTADASKAFFQRRSATASTALAEGGCIHMCFEPGTGLVRASFGTSFGTFGTMFPGIATLQDLAAAPIGPIELNLHAWDGSQAFRRSNRLVIAMSGATDVKGCRE